jgi:hypothetical protein
MSKLKKFVLKKKYHDKIRDFKKKEAIRKKMMCLTGAV